MIATAASFRLPVKALGTLGTAINLFVLKGKKVKNKKSAAEAKIILYKLIEDFHLENNKFPPFESWDDLQRARSDSGLDDADELDSDLSENLRICICCVETFHHYISSCTLFSLMNLLSGRRTGSKAQATFTIFSGMASDVGAIALLCRNGCDIQAKAIVRSLREKIDCLIVVQFDRAFATDFVNANNSEQANAFWHRRISRGKLTRSILRHISRHSKNNESKFGEDWLSRRKKFELWLGEAVHPSHTTGLLSAFPQLGIQNAPDEADPGWLGKPSDLSISTIRATMALAFDIFYIMQWRKILPDDDNSDLYNLHISFEKFISICTANTIINPNMDLLKLLNYFNGYMIIEKDEEPNQKKYEAEIARILLDILKIMQERFEILAKDIL